MLNELPIVLCDHILSFCNFDDMVNMHTTSNMWYKLCKLNKNLRDGPTKISKNMVFSKQKLIERRLYNFVCEGTYDAIDLANRSILENSDDKQITTTFTDKGIKVNTFNVGSYQVPNIASDGKYIAIWLRSNNIDIWSIDKKEKINSIKSKKKYLCHISIYYPYIAAYCQNGDDCDDHNDIVEYWNFVENKLIFKKKYKELYKVTVTNNGLYVYFRRRWGTDMTYLNNDGKIIKKNKFTSTLMDDEHGNSSFLLSNEYKYMYDTNKNEKCFEFTGNSIFIDYCKKIDADDMAILCTGYYYYEKYNIAVAGNARMLTAFDIKNNKQLWTKKFKDITICSNLETPFPYIILLTHFGTNKLVFCNLFDGKCYKAYENSIKASDYFASGSYIFIESRNCLDIIKIKCNKFDKNKTKIQTIKHNLAYIGNGQLIFYDNLDGRILIYDFSTK